ncbi:MAG: cytidylate kinase-like family protein [Deltaproteobacteria bacterium]|nr:cytidylate kinase-like family protein [Candidatus Anaeroferrophillacea bacterium]
MPVITISKEYCSGGLDIAKQLAKVLNIDYFDKQIVEQVAAHTKVTTDNVLDYEEERHISLKAYLSRVIDFDIFKKEADEEPAAGGEYDQRDKIPFNFGNQGWIDSDIYKEMISRVITSLGQRQHVLIVGRGGQCILQDNPDTIHIRVVADFNDRVKRALDRDPSLTPAQAEKTVREMDKKSRDYINYYFKRDWNDPLLYHVIINTSHVPPQSAVRWLSKLAVEYKAGV